MSRQVLRAAHWFEDALKNWQIWQDMSVKKYEKEYERLSVHFNVYTGESKVGKKLEEMGLIKDSEGAKLIEPDQWRLDKTVVR